MPDQGRPPFRIAERLQHMPNDATYNRHVVNLGPDVRQTTLGTVRKAAAVLNLFDARHPEWGVSDAAAALGVAKSSAHALLSSLSHAGLVRRTPRGRYRLGWQLLSLTNVLLSTTEFRADAHAAMEGLVARFGETVNLGVWEGGEIVYLDKLQGTRAVQISQTAIGARLPAATTAMGKVLLAFRPAAEAQDFLNRPNAAPLNTAMVNRILAELPEIRKAGYAYDLGDTVEDVFCVAAPIYNYLGDPIAAMSVSVPSYRFDRYRATYTSAVVAAAHSITIGDEIWWQAKPS